jgi:hypothetical protein
VAASKLYEQGDVAGAAAKYQQAYELAKDPRLLYDMAACARDLHAYARMHALLQRYERESGARLSPEDRTTVDEALAALQKHIGTLALDANVAGATVHVDGEPVGTTPLTSPIALDPGAHTIALRKDGYADAERRVDVRAGSSTNLSVALVGLEPPPAMHASAATQSALPSEPRAAPGPGWSPLVYAGFGVAAAGVVTGSITGALAMGKASAVSPHCAGTRCPTSVDGDLHAGLTLGNVSTVSFVVAGVGAGAGLVGLFVFARKDAAPRQEVGVAPWIGPASAGLQGTF